MKRFLAVLGSLALALVAGAEHRTVSGLRMAPPVVSLNGAATPDLVVRRVDAAGVTGDWQSLQVGGAAAVEIANWSGAAVGERFAVSLFEDTDGDARFDPGVDRVLGATGVDGIEPGGTASLMVPVSGAVAFRDDLLYAFADSGAVVGESDEGNNLAHGGLLCVRRPPPGRFAPALEWEWTGSAVAPTSDQVMMMPAVIDLTGDGIPEIVFSSYAGEVIDEDGRLRAIRGDGGGEVFTVTDPRYAVRATAAIAAGDIDGDGRPEVLAVAETGDALIAFGHDGTFRWRSAPVAGGIHRGGPAIADLDGDGAPEVVIGATVLDNRGRERWSAGGGEGENRADYGPLSLVADLDLAGDPEVVAGNTAYRADGRAWWWNRGLTDGFNAVGNFDDDPLPEVVLVTQQKVYLLEHDGVLKWGPNWLPGGPEQNAGGPPTVADVDGDGEPEIGVAGGHYYSVFETDGTLKWSSPTQDLSSNVTGSSVFDFEGDGSAEVVYSDERMLRIYRGADGAVLWETPSPSGTTYELPIVADVDADGNAEIVMVSNRFRREGIVKPNGIQVYGEAEGTWARTRQVWNQHTYHINNINDDGSIPRQEVPSWLTHNTYRLNLPESSVFAQSDLTASRLVFGDRDYPAAIGLMARIGNGGAAEVGAGLPVAFYDGDPTAGGQLIDVTRTAIRLPPGVYQDVEGLWIAPLAGAHTVYVVADDDGTGRGTIDECDETNNVHWQPYVVVPTPTPTPSPTTTPTPSPRPTATSTPVPQPVYLPIVLRERYAPQPKPLDVVLVIDASTSMRDHTSAGRPKLEAAVAAAGGFLDELQLGAGDRAAVVVFNREATLAQPLTADRAALARALLKVDDMVMSPTRIHRGIEEAHRELTGERRRSNSKAVMIVLTDGKANPEPPELAVARSDAAKAAGITVFTIGLGQDLDVAALEAMASGPGHFYWAPDAEGLTEIYGAIAEMLPCPAGQFWGRRC